MIGKTIAHYKILSLLGAGGMGMVYKALDEKLKRTVALKFLAPELTREPDAKSRFLHEAQAAAALHHPNICTVYEIDETNDQMYIAMACIEGQILRDRIKAGPLPLGEAHGHGVIHRDIKPANIMVAETGLALSPSHTKLTVASTTLGTPGYMSPEQCRGEDVDRRVDIWALGVMLYEMVSGRKAFQGDDGQAVIYSILNDDPEPLTGLRTGVPVELETIVGKALAKNRSQRYQHVDDLLVDLRSVKDSLWVANETVGPETRTRKLNLAPQSGKTSVVRRPLIIIGGVLAAALVLTVFFASLNIGNFRDLWMGEKDPEPIRSLAVLPFNNMMNDPDQDFFVDGMQEALLTELSKIRNLRVISRTTAMFYRETDKSIPEIARELDVDALIEGSVLRVGDQVRITAQLIRGSNDEHLWAEDYNRDLQDILNLLSEVAGSIAAEIQVALTPRQQDQLAADRTVDPEVYEMYLRGLHHLYKFTENDALESRRFFQQAIAAEPTFAPAHAGLAGSYIVFSVVEDMSSRELFPLAQESARKTLELDPGLSIAHTVLGFVELYFNWDWSAAEREFRQALEANPNDGDALHGLATVRVGYGYPDEAVEMVMRARRFDPYSYLRNLPVWVYLVLAHRYSETIPEIEKWREFSGDPQVGWYYLCSAYYQLGRHEEAMVELRHSTTGRDSTWAPITEEAYRKLGIQAAFIVCGERLAELFGSEYSNPLDVAPYFALGGDVDNTFLWLEKAYIERSPTIHMLSMPAFGAYREDARFVDLLGRAGFPPGEGFRN